MKRAKFIDTETARRSLKGDIRRRAMDIHAEKLSKELLAAQKRIRELEAFVQEIADEPFLSTPNMTNRARALMD